MLKKAFTLVEMLIVLVVVGILLALLVPNAIKSVDVANAKACAANIRAIDAAIHMHYAENRTWPADMTAIGPYLPSGVALTCPKTSASYTYDSANHVCNRGGHFDGAGSSFPDKHN